MKEGRKEGRKDCREKGRIEGRKDCREKGRGLGGKEIKQEGRKKRVTWDSLAQFGSGWRTDSERTEKRGTYALWDKNRSF